MDKDKKIRRSSILKAPSVAPLPTHDELIDGTQNFHAPSQSTTTGLYARRVSFSHRIVQKIEVDEFGRDHLQTPMEELLQTTSSSDGITTKAPDSSTFLTNADMTMKLFQNIANTDDTPTLPDQNQCKKMINLFKQLDATMEEDQTDHTADLFQNLKTNLNSTSLGNRQDRAELTMTTVGDRTANLFAMMQRGLEGPIEEEQVTPQALPSNVQDVLDQSSNVGHHDTTFFANALSPKGTPVSRRSTSFFRNAEPIMETSISLSMLDKSEMTNTFLGDRMTPEPQDADMFESENDATYTVAKEVQEQPVKTVVNTTEELTVPNTTDFGTPTVENASQSLGTTYVVDKSMKNDQKQVLTDTDEDITREASQELVETYKKRLSNESVMNEINNSKAKAEESVRKLRNKIRRSLDEATKNSPGKMQLDIESLPTSAMATDNILDQKAPEPLLDLSGTRTMNVTKRKSLLEEIDEDGFDEESFNAAIDQRKSQNSTVMLERVRTPEDVLGQLHLTQTLNTSGMNRTTGLLAPIPTGTGFLKPNLTGQSGLLRPIPTGQSFHLSPLDTSRPSNRIQTRLGTTMEVSEVSDMEESPKKPDVEDNRPNMFDSRFDPNEMELKMDKTIEASRLGQSTFQASQIEPAYPNANESMSLIGDTRPNPPALMTTLGAPTQLHFSYSNLQEPEDPQDRSSFFESYQKPPPFTLGESMFPDESVIESAVKQNATIPMDSIQEEREVEPEETEESQRLKREVTSEVAKLSPELFELLADFEHIDVEIYEKVVFLSSNNVDKDDLQVMEAFENLARARVCHLKDTNSPFAANQDPTKLLEKMALYLKLQALTSKKRSLVAPPKAVDLIRSARKQQQVREKGLEKWLRMLPEEQAIHDKQDDAIRWARISWIRAIHKTMLRIVEAEDQQKRAHEEKHKRFLEIALKNLPANDVE